MPSPEQIFFHWSFLKFCLMLSGFSCAVSTQAPRKSSTWE